VPPLVGVAVKVTDWLVQILVLAAFDVMIAEKVFGVLTVNLIMLEVTTFCVTQESPAVYTQ
jgi:hypothetical protein